MSGTSQDPLWTEPPWTSHFAVDDRVRSIWTGNTGTVVSVDPLGRHVCVLWDATKFRQAEPCRHGSERGLEIIR